MNTPIQNRLAVKRRKKRTPLQVIVQSTIAFFTHPIVKGGLTMIGFLFLLWLAVCVLILAFG